MELTYEPAERTFTIQSKFDGTASWSVHVVGSMRSERTESSFGNSVLEAPGADLEPEGVGAFYGHMSDLGLRYGDEFKPIRELAAGNGQSAGRVSLSENIAGRASEYALHPVLLDGALHVFSAGSKTVEDRKAKMKLPVRFARILFLRSPGASAQVRAKVLHFNEELIEGRIGIYDDAGHPCVLVDGFRAVAHDLRPPRRGFRWQPRFGLPRRLGTHAADRRALATHHPLPLSQLRDAATHGAGRSHRPAWPRRTASRDGCRG